MQRALLWAGVIWLACAACDDGAVDGVTDAATASTDGAVAPDAELVTDAQIEPDADLVDAQVELDASLEDAGAEPDAAVEPDAAIEPDAEVEPDAEPPPIDPALQAAPIRISEAAASRVVAVPGATVAETAEGLLLIEPFAVENLGEFGLSAAAKVGDVLLVADHDGVILAHTPTGLRPSPLDVPETVDLAVTPGPTLWVGGERLFRWLDGELAPVSLGDVPSAHALLAPGRFDGRPVIWAASDDAVFALETRPADVVAHVTEPPGVAESIAADSAGLAWGVFDGAVWAFDPDLGWHPSPIEGPAFSQVAADPGAPDVWLCTVDGTLWHVRDGRYRPVEGLADVADLAVRPTGDAVVATPGGVWVVRPGRGLSIDGLPAGPLAERTPLEVRPADVEQVEAVEVQVGDAAAELLPGPPWRWVADPAELGPGEHRVVFAVSYDDGEVARAPTVLRVLPPPTWVDDVRPLFEAECAGACHGERGSARRLDTVTDWRSQIDQIIDAVRAGRMPLALDPLSPAEIELLEAWRDAGMPEE